MFESRKLRNEWGEVLAILGPGPRVGAVELQKAQWLLSAQWRKRVAAVCSEVELSFTEWLVVDALRELYQELEDAVTQNAIAERAGLRRGNVSALMSALEEKYLVSRGPSASGRAWRVLPTHEAEERLRMIHPRLEGASRQLSRLEWLQADR